MKNLPCYKNSPIFFFIFFIIIKQKQTQQAIWKKTSYAKVQSNLCALNDATTEKQSLDLLFLSSPKIPAKFSQENKKGANTTGS
jgi:uncharacterized membrane protein